MTYDIEFDKWAREHPTEVSAVGIKMLLDEIDRCHKLIDALENSEVRSKSVVKRIHAQIEREG